MATKASKKGKKKSESEFDSVLVSMQTSQSKRAVQAAFEASPTQLGRAAVKHAKKKR